MLTLVRARRLVMVAAAALAVGIAAQIHSQVPANDDGVEAPAVTGIALPEDGPAYRVSEFRVRYVRENPGHPAVEEIMALPIELGAAADGFVAPRSDVAPTTITLDAAAQSQQQTYYASALQRILETVRDHLSRQSLLGVYVAPDPLQINEQGQDLRPDGNGPLTLVIATGTITEVRTLGSGERVSDKHAWTGTIKPEERINHPAHARILERSPIQPANPEHADAPANDLLRQDVLDRYLFHLSRHPGRRVDASVAASDEPGGVILDYQITENRPLVLYAQISNTGTKATDYWRQRFGFFHSQLTNNDDILSFDYITSWFDETNAVLGSYEAPFPNDRFRWRVHGNWTEFTADDVGFFGQDFTGESWAIGGELIWNFYQHRDLFLDLVGGVRFENIQVDNPLAIAEGDEDFIIPHVGLRLDQRTEWFATQANVTLEWWLSDADTADLQLLGRTAPDEDPMVLRAGLTHSVYLEPLLNRRKWEDLSTPKDSTLAHELFGSLRGQYAFGERLIPQAEHVVGGLYTVRGYPESIVAGDSAIIGTLEYRLHLPRLFDLEPEPATLFGHTFRRAPQFVLGPVDWDLIPKAFIDVGRTFISDRFGFETEETLIGAGIGIELLYRRNLNVRVDWGFALEELESVDVNEGSNRLHFVATILF